VPAETVRRQGTAQDELYKEASAAYAAAIERLAKGYEAEPERRRDLLQEIHLALWRSFAGFDGRCSLRTWVYRVAHNVSASHVMREQRLRSRTMVGLEALEALPAGGDPEHDFDRRHTLEELLKMIQMLKPLDRQVMLSYLEGLTAASIAEIVGISPGNVATRVHRIKGILASRFQQGAGHEE
jgi:RNA polymerase sigma-70 factor (ECF subfamily)